MWNMIMSFDSYYTSLKELASLELWYALKRVDNDSDRIGEAVNGFTDLYSFSVFYDAEIPASENKEWNDVLKKLPGVNDEDVKILMDCFEPRIKNDLRKALKDISGSFAGFMYEFHYEYFKSPDSDNLLTLHFRNYFAPDSPFNHQDELAEGLLKLTEKASRERPDVKKVQCATWINNIPAFLKLFPEEWKKNRKECSYEASTGWWGQFIDRKGGIHNKNAALFRRTAEFPFKNILCICTIDSLKKHLVDLV